MTRLRQFETRRTACTWIVWGIAGALSLTGCQTFSRSVSSRSTIDHVNRAQDEVSIDDVSGPTQRRLSEARWEKQRGEMMSDPQSDISQAYDKLEQAQRLYAAGEYRDAERAFARLAKERRKTYESFQARVERWWGGKSYDKYDPYKNFGDPVEEDALFMTGESQFAQKHYADAQDSYDELLNRYPNSRHVDHITRQLFRIARHWLDFEENVGDSGDTEVHVAAEDKKQSKPGLTKRVAVLPNVTDKSRPLFDTYGRGLQALNSIWLHDATGPLADDSLMLIATHHLRHGNFVEASRNFSLLREQYPDSPHFKDAFILGSHVALASYEGPAYDASSLKESIDLKKATLQLFPDLTPEQRERLNSEIERLEEADVARYWDMVEFYGRKDIPESVALHCYLIINRFPDSRYAGMAREKLQEIEPQLRASGSTGNFWQFRKPQSNSSPATEAEEDSRSRITLPSSSEPDQSGTTESPEAAPRKRSIFGFLKKTDTPPDLQPAPTTEGRSPGKASL